MFQRQPQPDGTILFWSPHCELAVRRPRPRAVVLVFSGVDAGQFGAAPFEELAADAAGAPIELFIDARHTRSASVDVSNDWALWMSDHRDALSQVSMLVGSKFIQITAEFVRRFTALGDKMRIYTDAAAFDEAVASGD